MGTNISIQIRPSPWQTLIIPAEPLGLLRRSGNIKPNLVLHKQDKMLTTIALHSQQVFGINDGQGQSYQLAEIELS